MLVRPAIRSWTADSARLPNPRSKIPSIVPTSPSAAPSCKFLQLCGQSDDVRRHWSPVSPGVSECSIPASAQRPLSCELAKLFSRVQSKVVEVAVRNLKLETCTSAATIQCSEDLTQKRSSAADSTAHLRLLCKTRVDPASVQNLTRKTCNITDSTRDTLRTATNTVSLDYVYSTSSNVPAYSTSTTKQ